MNSNHSGEKSKKKKNNEKKADQKAAKTLSALLLAFLITWLPYNLNVVMNSFCGLCLDKYPYWQSFGKKIFKNFKASFSVILENYIFLLISLLALLHEQHNQSCSVCHVQCKLSQDVQGYIDL